MYNILFQETIKVIGSLNLFFPTQGILLLACGKGYAGKLNFIGLGWDLPLPFPLTSLYAITT